MACTDPKECPCPMKSCANHGKCCECINSHRKSGSLVYCMREIAEKLKKKKS